MFEQTSHGEDQDSQKQATYDKQKKRIIGFGIVGVTLIAVIIILFTSIYRVDPGYMGVVYSMNGGVQDEVKGQGWHIVLPNQKVITYPVSTEMENIQIEAGTNDGKTVILSVQYAYHMNPEMLPHVFTKFRGRTAEDISSSYVNQQIRDRAQSETRVHSVLAVYSQDTTRIIQSIQDQLEAILAEDGIVLERFTISDVEPDEATLQTLQGIADAQNQNELLQREEANRAQEAINNRIEAEGRSAVRVIDSEAKALETMIEAEAQAEANALLEASLTGNLVQYEWIKQWDGIMPKVSGGDSGNLIQLPESILDETSSED